ncbi:MAG: hypothetical protein AAGA69_00055 [Pseudomonadota bacterium]
MSELQSSLFYAGLILLASAGLACADYLGLAGDADRRSVGTMTGLILAWCGNVIPKMSPGKCADDGSTRAQNMRRFAAWMLTVAGLLHAVIWLVAPISHANLMAMGVVMIATLLVLGRAGITRTWI